MSSRIFPLFLSAALLTAPAGAQTLIPLDSRPATSRLPAAIAGLGSGDLKVVPRELLGTAQQGADPARLLEWLRTEGAGRRDEPLIVALDALAYGGLVQSRKSTDSAARVRSRLLPLREWQRETGRPIYAFITVPRHPDAVDRERNFEVARLLTRWAAAGVFKELHIAWDDALPGSPAPAEGARLAAFAAEVAPGNVRVYPGADEVLALLSARALSPAAKTVQAVYSDPKLAQEVIKYEGIPLTRSVQNHAEAAGFHMASQGQQPDLTLYVFNGGDPRRAALAVSALLRRGPVAVADVEKVNLGNTRLWKDLGTLQRDANLTALAAWGTPGNNLGSALAHAKLTLDGVDPARQQALLAREYANDLIYSTRLRAALRAAIPEAEMNTPAAQEKLMELAAEYFPLNLGGRYGLDQVNLPWGRSFEWDFDLSPAE
ncbi:hypothetical protein Deipr_0835 [Deinococcus proteolyticus MRP]|uniref:DUF4127 family protein n=1 Tax=Deinococcus proteolyticus (strain ATCC 35074 / DSM 20540 / JCM 6276 / NBRC 101906 / NCIMB 13154 / VKM Ac-1939 / CCM 2703 / MRP) TaxID=693977 RepID=F0RM71_DEIPM|nr:DUF4127 family protein [Deinococcus proteolyticus]ADY25991.1 hypothetical protein Deipr_0835 [Deinococcus proteolyticus MRP]